MSLIHKTAMCLRFFGDDLDPNEISLSLGRTASKCRRKGETWETRRGTTITAQTGSWILSLEDREPGDLNGHILELFSSLNDDLSVWNDIALRFGGEIFCGYFMAKSNEVLNLTAHSLMELSSRGLQISFDIYDPITSD